MKQERQVIKILDIENSLILRSLFLNKITLYLLFLLSNVYEKSI